MSKYIVYIMVIVLLSLATIGCSSPVEERPVDLSSIPDVCKLGSEIIVDPAVQQEWDERGDEAIRLAAEQAGIKDGMPQVEAITLLNAYLCENLVYGENKTARTVSGALFNHQVVCVGYALAFQYIAQYCGIDVVYVCGYTKNTRHAWNGVHFSDGTYLEVDVTMNDVSGFKEKYLLLTPKEMESLHS